jgi:hypothetical protein
VTNILREGRSTNPLPPRYPSLDKCNKDLFPNAFKLLQILATLPVTPREPKRSFSILKKKLRHFRNSVGQLRLTGIAALNIHRVVIVEIEKLIKY